MTIFESIVIFILAIILGVIIFMLIKSICEIRECNRKIKDCKQEIDKINKIASDACKEVLLTINTFKYDFTYVSEDGEAKRICHNFSNEKYTIVLWHDNDKLTYASIHLNNHEERYKCVYAGDNFIADGKDVTIAFLTKLIEENHN